MSLLVVVKILTIPVLLWMVALISKRFGPMVAGIVSGLPIFSGPIVFYIALEQGADFAARSALGAFPGMIGYVMFGVVFVHAALYIHWFMALMVAIGTFFVLGWTMMATPVTAWAWVLVALVIMIVGIRWMPPLLKNGKMVPPEHYKRPPYFQMICGTVLMMAITALAPYLGPTMSGIMMFFPVLGGILGVFLLRDGYTNNSIYLYKGAFAGKITGWVFMLVIALMLPNASITITFLTATAIATGLSAISVFRVKHC